MERTHAASASQTASKRKPDSFGLLGGDNLYEFLPNINSGFDTLGLSPRDLRGIVSGSCNSIGKKWLKGIHGNAGVFPKSVADKIRGKSFDSFDDFRYIIKLLLIVVVVFMILIIC